ncbi:hypothetical protein ACQKKX_05750 [Neorhizobium sp. NPDC001467]|uniref:hypothetical protein n=1 Tax=Neorhizobium sp. NPDC001467 TaxID=3390595 RepID=UPI003D030EDA
MIHRLLAPAASFVLLLLGAVTVLAHEIGETRVALDVSGTHWTAAIVTAPSPLLNRLELDAGQRPSRDLAPESLEQRLKGSLAALADHIAVSFDGRSVDFQTTVDLDVPSDPALPTKVTIGLHGTVLANSQAISWRFDLPASRYALSFNDRVYWLDGGEESPPLPLKAEPPPTAIAIFSNMSGRDLHISSRPVRIMSCSFSG